MFSRLLAVSAVLFFSTTASGGIGFEFGQANYNVAPGGTVDVEVFLRESLGETILSDEGLFSAAVRVNFDQPPVPSDPAAVVSVSDIMINPAFDDVFFSGVDLTPGVSAGLFGSVIDPFSPVMVTSLDRILLGTFTFTAGGVAGEVTNLLATDLDPVFDETVSGLFGTPLDGAIASGMATITTTAAAVPEPSSAMVFGALLLIGALYGARRTMSSTRVA